jgi:hypothetical protein
MLRDAGWEPVLPQGEWAGDSMGDVEIALESMGASAAQIASIAGWIEDGVPAVVLIRLPDGRLQVGDGAGSHFDQAWTGWILGLQRMPVIEIIVDRPCRGSTPRM